LKYKKLFILLQVKIETSKNDIITNHEKLKFHPFSIFRILAILNKFLFFIGWHSFLITSFELGRKKTNIINNNRLVKIETCESLEFIKR
jgi:hypothetical protein